MLKAFLIRRTLLVLVGLALFSQTACNSKKKAVLTDKLINQLQVPSHIKEKYRAAEEESLSIVKEALKQVMQGTGDVNGRLDIERLKYPSLIEAVLLFDTPVALLNALKNKGVDLKHFDYKEFDSHPSLICLMGRDASYESLEWIVENEEELIPDSDRPPYEIVRAFWLNRRLTNQQREALIKALVPKGLNVSDRTSGKTLLHIICQKIDPKAKKEDKLKMVEWLFSMDEHINIRQSLHMENKEKRVPWEVAYDSSNYDLAAALIKKIGSSQEAQQKTLRQDETSENASGISHIQRFRQINPSMTAQLPLYKSGYKKIKLAFLSIEGIKKKDLTPLSAYF